MYYIAFARYDIHTPSYVDSGRQLYLTSSESDATATYRDWQRGEHWTEDGAACSSTIRRGCTDGPFESIYAPRLLEYVRVSDEFYGSDDEHTHLAERLDAETQLSYEMTPQQA